MRIICYPDRSSPGLVGSGIVDVSRTTMPRPPILDLLKAVTTVAPAHREVAVWWYVPPGSDPGSASSTTPPAAELVLQTDGTIAADLDSIRSRLAGLLGDPGVVVRSHRGQAEPNHLYRLLSRTP
jgi:hypothetical protein